jgi:hypothetical protein
MTNLAYEAGFVFDFEIASWFEEIAEKIHDCILLGDAHPAIYDPYDGHQINPTDDEGIKARKAISRHKNWIREQFNPSQRTEKFWKFMSVSDVPYMAG